MGDAPGALPDLEVRDVVKRFGDFTAVDRVSLTVPSGSFFSILGPSGCGKTSLMRMIAGFSEPDAGTIHIKGQDVAGIAANRRPANMVFQHLAFIQPPHPGGDWVAPNPLPDWVAEKLP